MTQSSSIPYYYNNINIFTSNTVDNSNNNIDSQLNVNKKSNVDSANYKNYLLNKVNKNADEKLKIYDTNKDSKKYKSRSNSNISKNN